MEPKKGLLSKALFCLSIFLFLSLSAFGQFVDGFEDGDFTQNPSWQGHEQDFKVNETHQLQLNAQGAGVSSIATPSFSINNAIWEVYLEMDFNPSSSNYARIYLVSDHEDLSDPLNGYFVMVGGAEDEVSLYKQKGEKFFKIIDGEDKKLDVNKVRAKIKVARDNEGEWQLWSAVSDTAVYVKEGAAFDQEIVRSAYAGIYCAYTATRSDKFYFDDFSVSGDPFLDTDPPHLIKVHGVSYDTLQLLFSEPLEPSSVSPTDFRIAPAIGAPKSIIVDQDNSSLRLILSKPLKAGVEYTLFLEQVADMAGNVMPSATMPFVFYLEGEPGFRDVVINEVMPDPNPVVGLPDAEYIELFNGGDKAYNLSGWRIADDKTAGVLGEFILLPGDFLILSAVSDTLAFKAYGPTLGVSPWPSLNNDKDEISLFSSDDLLIDRVKYTAQWYKSSVRNNGGYSLEMIDPLNPCSQEDNWKAAMDKDGGTPGKINSVFASKPDLKGPELKQVFPKDAKTLILVFNESIDTMSLSHAEVMVNKRAVNYKIIPDPATATSFVLDLDNPLEEGIAFILEVFKIKDCNGNYINKERNSFEFGLIQEADSGEVVINEVLFNPRVGGVDFVEIYNKSAKFLNARGWALANTVIEQEAGEEVVHSRSLIIQDDFLVPPQTFLVLTTSIAKTLEYYPKGKSMVEMSSMPSYPDKAGTVIVLDAKNRPFDRFDYSDAYHSPIISDVEGVSLERIAYDKPTQDPHNWASAASTHAFATPGEYNSQARRLTEIEGEIKVTPKVISPNNDGYNDYITIQYSFRNQHYVASVYVFDSEGRIVEEIARQMTLGASGFFSWDGTDRQRKKVKMGVYMLYFQVFDLAGETKIFKEPIVVGHKM